MGMNFKMKKATKEYLFQDLPVAETIEELETPLWCNVELVNGKILKEVNPKHILYIFDDRYGAFIQIYGKKYKENEIVSIDSQYPQPSKKLQLEMISTIYSVVNGEYIYPICGRENDNET